MFRYLQKKWYETPEEDVNFTVRELLHMSSKKKKRGGGGGISRSTDVQTAWSAYLRGSPVLFHYMEAKEMILFDC